jgi:hypothetical protein
MTDELVHMALFKEDEIDAAAEAVDRLRSLGVKDEEISVISGVPFSEKILGRPMPWTNIPLIGLSGAVLGILLSLALNIGTPLLYPIQSGGMALIPIPPTIVLTFELGMLGLMISTFLGVLVETLAPSYGPKGSHPSISDGKIGVLFTIHSTLDQQVHAQMTQLGAEMVHHTEFNGEIVRRPTTTQEKNEDNTARGRR